MLRQIEAGDVQVRIHIVHRLHAKLYLCHRYESATQRLAKAIRNRSTDDLAALVVDLHNYDRLCVPPTPDDADNEPIIVCTMGLRG